MKIFSTFLKVYLSAFFILFTVMQFQSQDLIGLEAVATWKLLMAGVNES